MTCVLFALLYGIATREGNRNGQDSRLYKGAAANMYHHHKLLDADGDPLIYHAPLYPLLLSVGVPMLPVFIWLLHLGSGLGILCCWTGIGQHYLRKEAFLWFFGALLSLSVPILMIAVLVWSEVVFLLLLSVHFYLLNRFLLDQREKWLYLAGLAGFLVLLQRNAGIFLFAGTLLGLFLLYRQYPSQYRLTALFWFSCISLAGSGAWNMHQILLNGNGHVVLELLPQFTPMRNFKLVFGELGTNFLPGISWIHLRITASALLLALIGHGVLKDKRRKPLLTLLLSVLGVYLLTWVLIPAYDNNISRFMSVVLPLFYFLLVYTVQRIWGGLPRLARVLITSSAAAVLLYNAVRSITNALNWGNLL